MPDYRYTLTRRVHAAPTSGRLGWVMLNPSTADETRDDPTIRKVLGFSGRAGYAEVEVANLFPMRATSPKDLIAATVPERLGHPASQADEAVRSLCQRSDAVVVAWGSHGGRFPGRVRDVAQMVRESGRPVFAILGPTKNGQPRHPLMAPYADGLVPVHEWLNHIADGGKP